MATQAYLIDQITRRSIFIIGLGNNQAEEARAEVQRIINDALSMVSNADQDGLFEVSAEVDALLRGDLTSLSDGILDDLSDFAGVESAWAASVLTIATSLDEAVQPAAGFVDAFNDRSMTLVSGRSSITATPNELLRTRLSESYADRIRITILNGATAGTPVRDIVSEVTDITNALQSDVQSNVLTLYNHYGNQTRNAVYESNSDIIDSVRMVATLDSRTSPTCQHFDGKVFPVNSGPRPPFHYNCRTQAVPVVNERFRIDIRGRTRASAFGPVDAQLTYDGFLRRQSVEFQNMVLGINRARAFRDGLPVDRFTNDAGMRLTLDQLEQLYPDRFD